MCSFSNILKYRQSGFFWIILCSHFNCLSLFGISAVPALQNSESSTSCLYLQWWKKFRLMKLRSLPTTPPLYAFKLDCAELQRKPTTHSQYLPCLWLHIALQHFRPGTDWMTRHQRPDRNLLKVFISSRCFLVEFLLYLNLLSYHL